MSSYGQVRQSSAWEVKGRSTTNASIPRSVRCGSSRSQHQPLVSASLGSTPAGVDDDQNAVQPDEVVTLGELAEMLKLDELAVMERVDAGDIPGRRFGDQWRFSRLAVLRWLDGRDAERPGPGFKAVR